MFFLNKAEKVLVLLYRIEIIRSKTLFGHYKSYKIGEDKIKKLKKRIIKLGGNPDVIMTLSSKGIEH